jgi:hypothetical protein
MRLLEMPPVKTIRNVFKETSNPALACRLSARARAGGCVVDRRAQLLHQTGTHDRGIRVALGHKALPDVQGRLALATSSQLKSSLKSACVWDWHVQSSRRRPDPTNDNAQAHPFVPWSEGDEP